jgi:hypothetical protein
VSRVIILQTSFSLGDSFMFVVIPTTIYSLLAQSITADTKGISDSHALLLVHR